MSSEGGHSELSGTARDVVQARNVSGGVHFHGLGPEATPIPRQLPGTVRGFVNRTAEVERLYEVLAGQDDLPAMTLIIITGTAGVGKTSLAVHWAHRVRDRFPDGQLYVNLRGYDPGDPVEPDEVLGRFLMSLGVPAGTIPAASHAKESIFRSLIADRRMLIVLDNASSVRQVRPLLPGTPSSLVLVTSRSRLSGLVARDGALRIPVDVLAPSEATELLRRATGEYRRHDDSAELSELAQLCARLPLALRIAAERAASRPQMPLRELIADLRDESGLWDALSAEDDDEADAVRAVFAWSYRALPADAARLFCLLGLHPGPHIGIPAAAALIGEAPNRTRHMLDVLVGAHLIEQAGPDRYQFHDLLRAYSTDRAQSLADEPAIEAARARLLAWYLHVASSAASVLHESWVRIRLDPAPPGVSVPPRMDFEDALRWYQAEQGNILPVTRSAVRCGADRVAWQLPAVLREVFSDRNPPGDWIALGGVGLEAARRVGHSYGEALFLMPLARTLLRTGQPEEALGPATAAVAAWRALGDRGGEANSLHNLSVSYMDMRRFEEAERVVEEGMNIASEIGHERHVAVAIMTLGRLAAFQEDFARSLELLTRALPLLRSHHHLHEATCLKLMAEAEVGLGRPTDAMKTAEAALATARRLENDVTEAEQLMSYARIQRANGRYGDAMASYHQSVALSRTLSDMVNEAIALDGTGETYQETGQPELATDFHLRAVTILRETGNRWLLAVALDHLATCLELTGDTPKAIETWSAITPLIADFPDRQATRLRNRVAEKQRRT
jgi:tetratricopeptide (TPR) repeat protein